LDVVCLHEVSNPRLVLGTEGSDVDHLDNEEPCVCHF
jgi:hypothetical protein